MKKYQFSLQSVLEYNTHLQNTETDRLGAMRREYDQVQASHETLAAQYVFFVEEHRRSCAAGIPASRAALQRLSIEGQKIKLTELEAELVRRSRQIEQQVERLLEATKDKMSVEKLRDASLERYHEAARRAEEHMIEEFVTNTAASAAME